MVKTASLYDNFCKTGNDVIDDVIIWVQDGNCKKMARENFSIAAFYNITKNQDNPIKTKHRWEKLHKQINKQTNKQTDRQTDTTNILEKNSVVGLTQSADLHVLFFYFFHITFFSFLSALVANKGTILVTWPWTNKNTSCWAQWMFVCCFGLGGRRAGETAWRAVSAGGVWEQDHRVAATSRLS